MTNRTVITGYILVAIGLFLTVISLVTGMEGYIIGLAIISIMIGGVMIDETDGGN